MNRSRSPKEFLHKHSPEFGGVGRRGPIDRSLLLVQPGYPHWLVLRERHRGLDGSLITIVMTKKHLYEKGSTESKQPKDKARSAAGEFLREHSLTLFFLVTGIAWMVAFRAMDPSSNWGQVVGNIVSFSNLRVHRRFAAQDAAL